MNEYDRLDKEEIPKLDTELIEATSLMRSVYWPKPDNKGSFKYYVTNEEITIATKNALSKYGIATIKSFYEFANERGFCGKRESWSIYSIEQDIDEFLGKKKEEPKKEAPLISDFEQSCRYIHLIYAPNQTYVDVLKQQPIKKLVTLTDCMTNKYGHKAIEILIDYCIHHRLVPRKGQWTHLTVETDIKNAIRWSVEKPDEYNKRVSK